MKTAISIPYEVFESAERLAKRTRKSRSQLYSDAVKEYVARHSAEEITEAINRVCEHVGPERDHFAALAARRTLRQIEW